MKRSTLHYIILELNAALDTGKFDSIGIEQVAEAIRSPNLVAWIRRTVESADLSLLGEPEISEYEQMMRDLQDAHRGNERRKWGIENRGLCLLVAWTNELAQQSGS